MRLNRHHRTRATPRWRETCVDGVMHVAYAAAVAAESAAERCARHLPRQRRRPVDRLRRR
jgi:hypothetical protein